MKSRRKARETALQALYQCDALDDWTQASVDLFFEIICEKETPSAGAGCDIFCKTLITAVITQREELDRYISAASARWSLQRMARVDRNIIRIAVAEIVLFEDIPASVSINEAIEVAKRFGTEESPQFINGVLDKVASLFHTTLEKSVASS